MRREAEAQAIPPAEMNLEARLDHHREIFYRAMASYGQEQSDERDGLTERFHPSAAFARETFDDLLFREEGKRGRAMVVMVFYDAWGGTDMDMAARAGVAMEVTQTGALAHDDVQDKSPRRRGGPSLHTILAAESAARGWGRLNDPDHNGVSLAIGAGTQGLLQPFIILGELEGVPAETRITAMVLAAKTMIRTYDGQNTDNSMVATALPSLDNIYSLMEAKTAHYTILNPMRLGMILAGATVQEAEALEDFAFNLGIAYQMRNDLNVIGTVEQDGAEAINTGEKDDIQNNKPTVLMYHALEIAGDENRRDLFGMLGKEDLTDGEFRHCQQILISSGAVARVREEIDARNQAAVDSIPQDWLPERKEFLRQVAAYIANVQK